MARSGRIEVWSTVTADELICQVRVVPAPMQHLEVPDGGSFCVVETLNH